MNFSLNPIAPTKAASAAIGRGAAIHQAISAAPLHVDINGSPGPCRILSDAYKSAKAVAGPPLAINVPPSVGIACLRSVPVDSDRDLKLIDYLLPYISFQSTIETLKAPPKEYLLDGVDILGGIQVIKEKLRSNQYDNQYEVMSDLRSIFAAASDSHFDYHPAILYTFEFARPGLNLMTLSDDGIGLPRVYMAHDIANGNNSSAVAKIDGIPIFDFLEKEAIYGKSQDPDAQYNSLFNSIPLQAQYGSGGALSTTFPIPDNHTVQFLNGTSRVIQNHISFPPGINFTGVDSGDAFHRKFEMPPIFVTSTTSTETSAPTVAKRELSVPTNTLYPDSVAKHSRGSIAGYFLNEPEFKDTVVLSILSFAPISFGSPIDEDFILEARDVLVKTVQKAREEKRDKLVIDLSANLGGATAMAADIYALLFPQGQFNTFGRFRASESLEILGQADYTAVRRLFSIPNLPLDSNHKVLSNASEFFGPYTVKGERVTAAMEFDRSKPEIPPNFYLNGYGPGPVVISEQPFKPENILIITDGTCASACTILAGLLTRNQGIRTLALGGRPRPYPMQAMGGVKGTLVTSFSDIRNEFKQLSSSASRDPQIAELLRSLKGRIPSEEAPPLLPVVEDGGRVNSRNDYTKDDLEGYPVHFKYEAANCRLFYTRHMALDVSETWRRAAAIAWKNGTCVPGSTANKDGTIGSKALLFDARVKSKVPGIKTPKPLAGGKL